MKPSKKRTELSIEQRRAEVAHLYLQGLTQEEIAEAVGVSQPTVSIDLKAIQADWKAQSVEDLNDKKLLELAKLDEAERNAWEQFNRSCEDATKTRREVGADGEFGEGYMEKVGQSGNPRYLDIVIRCIEKRCALLGLDAPQKVAQTDAAGNDISAEEKAERARQMLARHGYTLGTPRPSKN